MFHEIDAAAVGGGAAVVVVGVLLLGRGERRGGAGGSWASTGPYKGSSQACFRGSSFESWTNRKHSNILSGKIVPA